MLSGMPTTLTLSGSTPRAHRTTGVTVKTFFHLTKTPVLIIWDNRIKGVANDP